MKDLQIYRNGDRVYQILPLNKIFWKIHEMWVPTDLSSVSNLFDYLTKSNGSVRFYSICETNQSQSAKWKAEDCWKSGHHSLDLVLETGATNENIVQNHSNIALLNVFWYFNGRRAYFYPLKCFHLFGFPSWKSNDQNLPIRKFQPEKGFRKF